MGVSLIEITAIISTRVISGEAGDIVGEGGDDMFVVKL